MPVFLQVVGMQATKIRLRRTARRVQVLDEAAQQVTCFQTDYFGLFPRTQLAPQFAGWVLLHSACDLVHLFRQLLHHSSGGGRAQQAHADTSHRSYPLGHIDKLTPPLLQRTKPLLLWPEPIDTMLRCVPLLPPLAVDRKSTRLNSS